MLRGIKPIIAFLAIVLLMGAAHGIWVDRWVPSQELQQSIAKLETVPMTAGDWRGENVDYEAEDMARAGIKGCVLRKYQNTRTGETVSVLLVTGRGGPISVHTPDVCYTSAGFEQMGGQSKVSVGDAYGDFWKGIFVMPNAVVPRRLEIMWAWSRDGISWSANDKPRYAYARHAAVYKMYIVREPSPTARTEDEAVKEFLKSFLPALQGTFTEK